MNNLLTKWAATIVLGSASAFTSAYSIDGGTTDVGELDLVIGMEEIVGGPDGNQGNQAELDFIESILGEDIDFIVKEGSVPWESTFEDELVVAFALGNSPTHFLAKNGQKRVLFSNTDLLKWGVINTDGLGLGLGDDMIISHVSEINDPDCKPGDPICNPVPPGGEVPVPGTLILLGLGLLALGSARKA